MQHVPRNVSQPELPRNMQAVVEERVEWLGSSLFGGLVTRGYTRTLLLNDGQWLHCGYTRILLILYSVASLVLCGHTRTLLLYSAATFVLCRSTCTLLKRRYLLPNCSSRYTGLQLLLDVNCSSATVSA